MTKKTLVIWLAAPISGALTLTVWGMLFWGLLYDYVGVFQNLPPEMEQAAQSFATADIETGTYFYPWPRNTSEAIEVWLEKHRSGPFFKISYVQQGVDPQTPGKILGGVGLYLLVALLATALLRLSGIDPRAVAKSATLILFGGAMGTLLIQVGDPIWFHLPWDYVLGNLVFELVAWTVLGLTVAWVLKTVAARD